jgi:hypothetical protein
MNPEIKAQWLAALRSGEYEQGSGTLKTDLGQYCCMGVLCKLAADQDVVSEKDEFYGQMYPSYKVITWSGIPTLNPVVTVNGLGSEGRVNLADLNDTYNYSFAQIADLIEAQL